LSICGAGGIATLIAASARLGLTATNLIDYRTSGDVTGDRSAVVGYAAISFFRREDD
ncbi:AmmeMemoRadiSam system protein B, partial [Candidatus Acetothermia bacterium]